MLIPLRASIARKPTMTRTITPPYTYPQAPYHVYCPQGKRQPTIPRTITRRSGVPPRCVQEKRAHKSQAGHRALTFAASGGL